MKNKHTNTIKLSIAIVSIFVSYSGRSLAWGEKCEDLAAGLVEINAILSQNLAEANSAHAQIQNNCGGSALSGCSYATSYYGGLQGNIIKLRREKQAILGKLSSQACDRKTSFFRTSGRAICGRSPAKTEYSYGVPTVIYTTPNPETGKNYMTVEENYKAQCGAE